VDSVGGFLRRHAGRIGDRGVQDRAHPSSWAVALLGGRGVRDPGMCRLVQPP